MCIPALRQHPSSLIFWRCWFDLAFALVFVAQYVEGENVRSACKTYTPLLFFTLFGSICYFGGTTFDLYFSLRNPINDPESNLKPIHFLVWFASLLVALIINGQDLAQYHSTLQVCWIKTEGTASDMNVWTWLIFFIPLAFICIFSIATVMFAFFRLKSGLQETYELRMMALWDALWYTISFCLYWFVAMIFYIAVLFNGSEEGKSETAAAVVLALIIGLIGIVDVGTWIARKFTMSPESDSKKRTVNTALIKEIVNYTSYGMTKAVDSYKKTPVATRMPGTDCFPSKLFDEGIIDTCAWYCQRHLNRADDIESIRKVILKHPQFDTKMGDEVPFYDFAPEVFRYLRYHCLDLDDEGYLDSVGYSKERMDNLVQKFSDGRSGAFFYFSHDSRFLIKTIPVSEAYFFLSILPEYAKYLEQNPDTLLNKIIALHAIEIYGVVIYFVVMENIFVANMQPHEKYDIKGSWVDRNTQHRTESGKLMKDNDLHKRMIMRPHMKHMFLGQLEKDTSFMRDLGIMDYSLILGIYYMKVMWNRTVEEEQLDFTSNLAMKQYTPEKRLPENTTYETWVEVDSDSGTPRPLGTVASETSAQSIDYEMTPVVDHNSQMTPHDNLDSVLLMGMSPENKDSMLAELSYEVDLTEEVVKRTASKYRLQVDDVKKAHRIAQTSPKMTTSQMLTYRGGLEAAVCQGPGIYYVGIIDILQQWNLTKKLERILKGYIFRKDPKGISCVPPDQYQKRFMNKMHEITVSDRDFFHQEQIDQQKMCETNHKVHIFPPPEEVRGNIELARRYSKSRTFIGGEF